MSRIIIPFTALALCLALALPGFSQRKEDDSDVNYDESGFGFVVVYQQDLVNHNEVEFRDGIHPLFYGTEQRFPKADTPSSRTTGRDS